MGHYANEMDDPGYWEAEAIEQTERPRFIPSGETFSFEEPIDPFEGMDMNEVSN